MKTRILCHAHGFTSIIRFVMTKNALQKASIHFLLMLGPISWKIFHQILSIQRVICSMAVLPACQNEMITNVKNLKQSSPGWDDLSSFIVKHTFHYIIEPLMHGSNLSITQVVFPHELKAAKVILSFQSNDHMVFSNYRPVSVLPLFSKIWTSYVQPLVIVCKQMPITISFSIRVPLWPFTWTGIHMFVGKFRNALENGEYVLGLFQGIWHS